MGVKVKQISFGGGGGAASAYFADNFNRPDQPFLIGDNWGVMFLDADVQTTALQAQNFINVSANNLVIAQASGGSTWPKFIGVPLRFNGAKCWGANQFAEWLVNTANLTTNTEGPAVSILNNPNTASAYGIDLNINGAAPIQYSVARWVNFVRTDLTGGFINFTMPLTFRIEAKINPGDVTLSVFLNGVLTHTIVDNAVSRLLTGIPGIYCVGVSTGSSFSFQNFKCGTMPQVSQAVNFP